MTSRIDNLADSCSKNLDSRLSAADHLMELIVLRIKNIGPGRYVVENHVWEAGELLFRLTISFQQNQLTRSQCIRGVETIKQKLNRRP